MKIMPRTWDKTANDKTANHKTENNDFENNNFENNELKTLDSVHGAEDSRQIAAITTNPYYLDDSCL
jgi:hypothetical protein